MGNRRKLSKEAIDALEVALKNNASIDWIALDAFRVWYTKPLEDGVEIVCKEFEVREV